MIQNMASGQGLQQGNQVPGISQAGPENRHLARKPRIIFYSPEVLKNKTFFLNFMDTFANFHNICVKKVLVSSKFGVYDVRLLKFETDFHCSPEFLFLEKWSLFLPTGFFFL